VRKAVGRDVESARQRVLDREYFDAIKAATKQADEEANYQARVAAIDRRHERRLAECRASAAKFETRSEFNKGASRDYSYAYHRGGPGFLDEICSGMRPPWSRMICYHMPAE
jgi:hypothetical protein